QEAKALGLSAKPVLVGPVSFLLLGKARGARFDRLELLDGLLGVYAEVLGRLAAAGATWVQIDEPALVLDRTPEERSAFRTAYRVLSEQAPGLKLLLTTYFDGLRDNLDTALELPVAGLHVDLVRAPAQLDALLGRWPAGRVLSLGVVDGRNIWKADLAAALATLERASARLGAERAAGAPAAVSHHHDRVVPPDGGGPGGAPPVPRRQDDRVGIRALHPGPDPADTQDPGGPGTRRARTRRVRAQRHGGVLRGAAPGVRLHRARLGAVLRLPLREAADHLRRRVAPQADDRAVEH